MTRLRNSNTSRHPVTVGRSRQFGAVIRTHREKLGWSQERLATEAGRGRQFVNRVENAAYSTHLHYAWLLADALGVPLSTLIAEAEALEYARLAIEAAECAP